jgi:hypothetical protein
MSKATFATLPRSGMSADNRQTLHKLTRVRSRGAG